MLNENITIKELKIIRMERTIFCMVLFLFLLDNNKITGTHFFTRELNIGGNL